MANGTIDKIKDRFGPAIRKITSGTFGVKDTQNVDSQVSRSQMETPDSEPAVGRGEDLVKLGNQRWEESRQAFWWHREQFFRGMAAYKGKQGQTWNSGSDNMMPAGGGGANPDEMERLCRVVTNIIQPKVELFIARTFAAFPDAWAVPHSDSDADKAAAQVGRSIISHCRRVTNLAQKLEEGATDCAVSTNVYFEIGWNSHSMADFGFPQPDGSVVYKRLPGGEIHCTPLLSIDIFPDPNASLTGDIHDGAYLIKRSVRTTSFVKAKWGVTVEGTTYDEAYVHLMRRLQWQAGDTPQGRTGDKNATDVTEVWEKPVPGGLYPDGRYWVYTTDGTICHAGPWPYKFKERYPFVKLGIKKNSGSVWDLNFVDTLLDTQKEINGLETYLYTRQQTDRPTEYVDDMAGVPPDDLLSPSLGRTMAYDGAALGGRPPAHYVQPPAPGDFYFKRRENLMSNADILSGVRDMNSDQVPPPNSGYEYEQRIEEDRTRVAPFVRRVGNATVEIYDWFIKLYEQYGCAAPRMLFIDDKNNDGNSPTAALTDVKILRNGMCRVELSKGSGQAKSLAAQEEFLEKFVTLAAKGVAPPILEFWLKESQFIRSDATVDKLLADYTKFYHEEQAQALKLQQMKGQQGQDEAQQKAQQAQAESDIKLKSLSDEMSLKVHSEALSQQFRSQADQANERQRVQNSISLENLKFEHEKDLETHKNLVPDVSWTFPFKPGPKMTNSAAKEVGLTPDSDSTLMTIAAPPKPQPRSKSDATASK